MDKPLFNKVAIVGVGLIGGSLGLAIKKKRLAKFVIGVVRREASGTKALQCGAVDLFTLDMKKGVQDADLVILCSRVFTITKHLKEIKPYLKSNCIVMDVGSSKTLINETADRFLTNGLFVGCHPMAGSEKRGVSNASGDLFKDSVCFVTKKRNKSSEKVWQLWQKIGAKALFIPGEAHDRLVGESSHLPHLLAFMQVLDAKNILKSSHADFLKVLNPSFRDVVRLAKSDPEQWVDIFLSNREVLLKKIQRLQSNIKCFRDALCSKRDNKHTLELLKLLVTAKHNADKLG